MISGKKVEWEKLELRLHAEGSYVRSNSVPEIRIGGSARTEWTPSSVELRTGILINAVAILAGSGTIGGSRREYNLSIPDLLVNVNKTLSGFSETVDSHVVIENLRIYASPYAFTTKWDNLKWYVEGALEFEYGALEFNGNRLTHSGIFLLGLLGMFAPTAGITPFPIYGDIIRSSLGFTAEVESEVKRGWRFKKNGQWYTPDCSIIYGSIPEPPENCSIDFSLGTVSVENTYNFAIKGRSKVVSIANDLGNHVCEFCPDGSTASPPPTYHVIQHINRGEASSGYILCLPDLEKDVHLIGGDDFACVVYRGGLPRTSRVGFNSCCEFDVVDCEIDGDPLLGCDNFASSTITVNPSYLRKIDVIRDSNKSLLDPLTHPTYSPYEIHGLAFESAGVEAEVVDPGGCPVEPPDTFSALCLCFNEFEYFKVREKSHRYPVVQIPVHIGAFQYYRHENPLPMYIDYWGNPLWSFFDWFPPNRDEQNWKVFGSKIKSDEYWLLLRQQYADAQGYSPSVFPTSSRSKTRLDLVSDPLIFSGFSDMVNISFLGVKTSWFTVHNFNVDLPIFGNIATTQQSNSRFIPSNCTLNFTPTRIEVQPTASTCEVAFLMLSWLTTPYVSPAICNELNVNWENANVNSINVYAESQSGFRVLITSTQGNFNYPRELDTHYAGSYAQDFILSQGVDVAPNGLSASTYSKADLALAHSLIRGSGMYKLVFKITPVNPANVVKLHYPFFYEPENPTVIPETANTHAILYANGAGIRYGQLQFWDEISNEFLFVPKFRQIFTPMTVLDYLCYRRLLYDVKEVTNNLDAELQALYDITEGNTREDASKHTIAFPISYLKSDNIPIDGRYILINSFRECPPLVSFPLNKRNEDLTFNETELSHEVFALSLEPRRYISASDRTDLRTPSDTIITNLSTKAVPAGWVLTEHKLAVTNNETNYEFIQNDEEFALFNNWHGCFLVLSTPDLVSGSEPRISIHRNNRQVISFLRSDDEVKKLSIGYGGGHIPQTFTFIETDLIVKTHAIDYDNRTGDLCYIYIDDDDAVRKININEGVLTMPLLISESGDNVAVRVSQHGLTYAYYSQGVNLYVKAIDAEQGVVVDAQTNLTIDANSTFDVSDFVTKLGEWRIAIVYVKSGEIKYATSTNGVQFE